MVRMEREGKRINIFNIVLYIYTGISILTILILIKGSLDEKLPSYELLKMLEIR